ncbi:MAG: SMC-Scp complex subunit ScpB [Myxococcota bacterium]|nr:SMC-Scp complex subunit ScpB [Myxococcota bacterium]
MIIENPEEADLSSGATGGAAVHAPPPEGVVGGTDRSPPTPMATHAEELPEEVPPPTPAALRSVLESLLLVADRPLPLDRLRELCALPDVAPVREALEALRRQYQEEGRGFQIHEVAGAFQLRTAAQNAPYVQRLLQQKPVRLSRAQLETLAIVAYRQPITRPEIDEIRGVDSAGTLKVLLERNLVRVLGKKEEPGRPLLYGTTRTFLEFFNLRDLRDLPTLREFYELSEEHQAQVSALGAALDEMESPRPASPPPLTRVEIKDLGLGDEEEELARIDAMIHSVHVETKIEQVLEQAGITSVPPPPPVSPPQPEEREPEEL